MATCVVSGIIKDPSEIAVSGAIIRAYLVTPYFTTTIHIVPTEVTTTTSGTGTWSLTLNRSASFIISIEFPPNITDSRRKYNYTITVPNAATADFSTLATEA